MVLNWKLLEVGQDFLFHQLIQLIGETHKELLLLLLVIYGWGLIGAYILPDIENVISSKTYQNL